MARTRKHAGADESPKRTSRSRAARRPEAAGGGERAAEDAFAAQLLAEVERLRAAAGDSGDAGLRARLAAVSDERVTALLLERGRSGARLTGTRCTLAGGDDGRAEVQFLFDAPPEGWWLFDRSFAVVVDLGAAAVVEVLAQIPERAARYGPEPDPESEASAEPVEPFVLQDPSGARLVLVPLPDAEALRRKEEEFFAERGLGAVRAAARGAFQASAWTAQGVATKFPMPDYTIKYAKGK